MKQETWGRKDLIEALEHHTCLSPQDSTVFMEEMIDLLKEALLQEGKVKIHNFGSFEVYDRKERLGRNPVTREEKMITARKAIRFKPSLFLNQKIKVKK